MKPEEEARQDIDKLLEYAGWVIQDYENLNLGASLGVAIREFRLNSGTADYLLFIDRNAVGVIEAKPKGTPLRGVDVQSGKYMNGVPDNIPHEDPLPFAYESTGIETLFRDTRDPDYNSRGVFAFHKPETLQEWLFYSDTLRARLRDMPTLMTDNLRMCQIDSAANLEKSLAENRPRALIQMATGSGKTYAAITSIYRLIKFAGAKRILFLVDRNNLGKQADREFKQYIPPDDNRKFTELYNVQRLKSNSLDPVSKVCITTIQRLYSMLNNESEFESEFEQYSLFDTPLIEEDNLEISYNPNIPIETFDFIVTDECHRSIYNLWRQVLEYFDSFIIGLTATPSKQTLGFFNQNLVTEYSHERAVADGVNVGYEIYRIKTKISEEGSKIDAGFSVDKRDRETRKIRWEKLEEDFEYDSIKLDRDVVALDQIRTIIKTFKERLPEIYPKRKVVPKTLVFAKNDSHADDIVNIIREEFGKGNEFCRKITYRTTGEKTENLISDFRNSYDPRIAVTVDMISTGTDIKPVECLFFMRDVKSKIYFEQMKGRGTRTINPTDLRIVTPDADYKTHFVIVDAVGVTDSPKNDTISLERNKTVSFEKLMNTVAFRDKNLTTITDDILTTIASRLSRMDLKLNKNDRQEIELVTGKPIKEVINGLIDAVDTDKHITNAIELYNINKPSIDQINDVRKKIIEEACKPFDSPNFRKTILEIKKKSEQTIDTISKDNVILAGFDENRAHEVVENFQKFIEDNRDEITALQIIYNRPYGQRHLTFQQIKEVANAIKKPPYNLNQEIVWEAYKKLKKNKVNDARPEKLLTDIVSLLRFAIGELEILEPFQETVEDRFQTWLSQQKDQNNLFTPEQIEWLYLIKDHIVTSLSIEIDDFENVPFYEKGGAVKVYNLFGEDVIRIIDELNEVLAG